jgi:prepilin-type N-terminal cleavage/methylation domain-containing protein/prepilin-type processing-associated H-X9-DG protein
MTDREHFCFDKKSRYHLITNPHRVHDIQRPRLNAGFTLIEMLVVIAIIALLASIIVPATQKALHRAQSTKSLSNLQQIGQAVMLYAVENKGDFPLLNRDNRRPNAEKSFFWVQNLEERVLNWDRSGGRGKHPIFQCPAAKDHHGISDYGPNPFLFHDANPNFPGRRTVASRLGDVAEPSNLLMVATARLVDSGQPSWYIQMNWAMGGNEPNQPDPRLFNDRVGVVFVDGHVQALDPEPIFSDLTYRSRLMDPSAERK